MVNLTPKEKSPNVSVRLSGGLEALKNWKIPWIEPQVLKIAITKVTGLYRSSW
jgi:hypothetical protein